MNKQSGILLTGANGFVGRNVYKHLIENRYNVWPVVRSGCDSHFWQNQKNLISGDLLLLEGLPGEIEVIIHAAASPLHPAQFKTDNIAATTALAELARSSNVSKFIFFSAMSVYGNVRTPIVNENTPVDSPSLYGASKLAGEKSVLAGNNYLTPVILRVPGVIGAGSHRNWLSRMKDAVIQDQNVEIYNANGPFNNAVHLTDLLHLMEQIVPHEIEGGVYTLAANGTISIRQVIETLIEEIGSKSEIEEKPTAQLSWTISNEKAKKKLGYRPMSIGDMIRCFSRES